MHIHLSRAALLASLLLLPACSAVDRIENIGKPPALAPINSPMGDPAALPPQANLSAPYGAQPNYPLPRPQQVNLQQANSLWSAGARSFFPDPRANKIGDIITINISISDAAKITNSSARSRANSDNANMTNLFGLEGQLTKLLPSGADPTSLVKMGSTTSNLGAGTVDRSENVNLTLAGVVTQVLPNGNLVVRGHQQVRVNYEMRDLQITGIVRTEDITNNNTIQLAQIAEARVSYGGQGQISDVQQPRYGSQLYDILMPF